jgi:CubicO group peptidase (beta-lactamase class C family)
MLGVCFRRKLIAIALTSLALIGPAAADDQKADLAVVSPTDAGWSEAALTEARDWSQKIHSTAVIIIEHDKVVAAWGDVSKRTELASGRKSLLSAMIGIAVKEGKLSLDSTLAQLGIDDNPPSLTEVEKQATVRMLIEARSGVYHPALAETPAMAALRPRRGSHEPGTYWYYNNWDFNTLGTIYEHATGTGIYDALDSLIARPIGMQDYRPEDGTYVTGAESIYPAYPIRMSARDLARFALLYLHDGMWAGHQVVPSDWVRESTRSYSMAQRGIGYGYLWWTAGPERRLPEGTFFAVGAGGQYAFVFPAFDMVVVSRVDRDMNLPDPRFDDIVHLMHLVFRAAGLEPYDGDDIVPPGE